MFSFSIQCHNLLNVQNVSKGSEIRVHERKNFLVTQGAYLLVVLLHVENTKKSFKTVLKLLDQCKCNETKVNYINMI